MHGLIVLPRLMNRRMRTRISMNRTPLGHQLLGAQQPALVNLDSSLFIILLRGHEGDEGRFIDIICLDAALVIRHARGGGSTRMVRLANETLGTTCFPSFFNVAKGEAGFFVAFVEVGEPGHEFDEFFGGVHFRCIRRRRRKPLIKRIIGDIVQYFMFGMNSVIDARWDAIVENCKFHNVVVHVVIAGLEGFGHGG